LLYELTKREREVFWLLAQGFDNQEIAEALCVAEQTVRNRVSTIYSKLGVRDRLRLIRLAASWRSEH
jgi:DNA-binding NarL/FixJ family response regulator